MAKGSKVNIWNYIDKLAPFLRVGMSIEKSCIQAEVPRQTVEEYMRKDGEVRQKIMQLKEDGLVICRQIIFKAAKEGNWRAALAILERKDKNWLPPIKNEFREDKIAPDIPDKTKQMTIEELHTHFKELFSKKKI